MEMIKTKQFLHDIFPNLKSKLEQQLLRGEVEKAMIAYIRHIEPELLKDFFLFFRNNGENMIGLSIEQFIKEYLKSKDHDKDKAN